MNDSSRPWVKICANTSLHDAQIAADAGADAVGFVFAPSPRQVTPAQVADITPHLPASLEKIGVFVDWDIDQISAAVRQSGLTGVQLHSHGGPSLPRELRQIFGAPLRILRVVHFGPDAAEQARALAADANIDGILIDSRTATMVGGTGLTFDWNEARSTIFGRPGAARLIAAGGLTPANVREAIATLQPWGVDVASGVEAAPGRKDPAKVRQFVAAARHERTYLTEALPEFADELTDLLTRSGKPELAAQIADLPIASRCSCGDDFCATFYTVYRQPGNPQREKYCLDLEPKSGQIILDIVGGEIAGVEVLHRDDVRNQLRKFFP